MNEQNIQQLLDSLFKLTYTWESSIGSSSSHTSKVISDANRLQVEQVIRQHLIDNASEKIGILEAKVFTYERIIANSNFAPLIRIELPETEQQKSKFQERLEEAMRKQAEQQGK